MVYNIAAGSGNRKYEKSAFHRTAWGDVNFRATAKRSDAVIDRTKNIRAATGSSANSALVFIGAGSLHLVVDFGAALRGERKERDLSRFLFRRRC